MKRRTRFLQLLPAKIRQDLIRYRLNIPQLKDARFSFGIASTRADLEAAYRLLHDCYVKMKLMDPHPSGLRCNLYSALPYTTTVIAKYGNEVVGTLSLIKDSPVGLPSDGGFSAENQVLRARGDRLVEVSALAVHPKFREKNHLISLYLMKYMQEFTTKYMDCTTVCATVHPRAADFYEALFGFRATPHVIPYDFVKGAPAVHVAGSITTPAIRALEPVFFSRDPARNLSRFITEAEAPFSFPERVEGQVLDPVMTPELLDYFFVKRTQLFQSLSRKELDLVKGAYEALSGWVTKESGKRYRLLCAIPAAILSRGRLVIGKICDISQGGVFFATPQTLKSGEIHEVLFECGGRLFRLLGKSCWRNQGQLSHHPKGYGIGFSQEHPDLFQAIQSFRLVAHNPGL